MFITTAVALVLVVVCLALIGAIKQRQGRPESKVEGSQPQGESTPHNQQTS